MVGVLGLESCRLFQVPHRLFGTVEPEQRGAREAVGATVLGLELNRTFERPESVVVALEPTKDRPACEVPLCVRRPVRHGPVDLDQCLFVAALRAQRLRDLVVSVRLVGQRH